MRRSVDALLEENTDLLLLLPIFRQKEDFGPIAMGCWNSLPLRQMSAYL